MQSFRQYHRFRTHLERQYERDRDKAAALAQARRSQRPVSPAPPTTSSSSSSSSEFPDTADDEPDLERGQGARETYTNPIADEHAASHETSTAAAPVDGDVEEEQEKEKEKEEIEESPSSAEHTEPASDARLARPPSSTQQRQSLERRSTRHTFHTVGTALGITMTGVSVRSWKEQAEEKRRRAFVVGYEGPNDPLNPHNWGYGTRIWATMMIASIGFVVGVASSIDSEANKQAAADFGVSQVTESLATGIYLIGFGAGSLFAGPFSETLGRNPVYISTLAIFMIFIMASALAPNIGAQLAFRFLAGFFGSTPLTCAGGSIADLWNPMERVFAFPVFANAAFTGPVIGPVMGGFIAQSSAVSWRWTEWTTLIMSGLVLGLVVLTQPETYPALLLRWKAEHLRRITGDDRYMAEVELRGDTLWQRLKTALYRPFLLTFNEPIVILVALYLTVIYIVLFTFLDGYDYIFGEIHGTSQGITGLCFLGIVVGLFGASALVPLIYKWARRDLAKIKAEGGDRLPPEFRLWFSMLGGSLAIPVSLFWMGWTSDPGISIWSPLAASVLFGYGILTVFISSYQYIIDSYEIFSASALASVTLIRYVAAGGMVVVGIPFYENMGVHYTLTILACISALLVPVPYIFFKYGARIRAKSKYAPKK